jgi:RNA polymerase sigma-70 factor (ECF subfamily)
LIRVLGDIDLAEDAVAEAFAIAAEQWPTQGVPPNPGGWITTTARNRAIDRLRRESTRTDRHRAALRLDAVNRPGFDGGSVQATAVVPVPGLVRLWASSNSIGDILPIE